MFVQVLTDKVLLQQIGSFTRGIPAVVLEFEQKQLPRCGFENPDAYPKRVGALPQIAIVRNNQVVLKALYSLSTHPLHKLKTKFKFDEAMRCAAYFNRLDILQWLLETMIAEKQSRSIKCTPRKLCHSVQNWGLQMSNWTWREECGDDGERSRFFMGGDREEGSGRGGACEHSDEDVHHCDAEGLEGEEHKGMDLFDAFEDFNIRSQHRIQELLDATERKMPWYIVAYSIDALETVQCETDTDGVAEALAIFGRPCATTPDDVDETNEEIILADGFMEEILAQDTRDAPEHWDSDEERDQSRRGASCPSPRTTQMNEIVDALTFDCFSSTVAPMVASFFQTLLQKQQLMITRQREAVERATRQAIEDQIAAEQAERLRQEQLAIEQEELAPAIAKAAEEETLREAERIELARQLQREENDDEEVKIRTLAYSHTRECAAEAIRAASCDTQGVYEVAEFPDQAAASIKSIAVTIASGAAATKQQKPSEKGTGV
ncbi:hypothetical protein FI667_g10977, partial [Globisporangium splendens]